MNIFKKPASKGRKLSKNQFMTKSGAVIKVKRSLSDRFLARSDNKARRKADSKHTLPKNKFKRLVARLEPKRMYHYWFSREGGIMALKITGVGVVAGFLLAFGLFAYFRKDLPNLKDISGNNIGGSMRYYDKTGKTLLWEDYDAVKRIPVQDTEISQYMKDATVAIEDKDFFKHGGFDVRGIARAGFNDAFGHGGTQGGSTITQQLVKLTQNWSGDRTITRKVKELILSVELERSYSKQEILTGYLNTAPYGGIEYGVEAASRDYFQKSAKDLTLSEAAMLAAIPKSPRYYSPYNSVDFDKSAFEARKNYILEQMADQGKITKAQAAEAEKVDVIAEVKPRQAKYDGIKAPWFVLAAKKELEDKYGDQTVKRGGWTVTTSLDLSLQTEAEKQVNNGMAQVRRQGGDTAAFAAEDVTTGQMVALVGGSDFTNPEYGQINYAQTPLPPGSSFKPYDYTALMENNTNVGAGSVLYDTLGPIDGYPCTNKNNPKGDKNANCLWDYDFQFPGAETLRYALGGSRNVPAVKAMLITGVNKTIETAEKLGLKSGYKCYADEQLTKETQCYASSAIGDGSFLHLDEHVHGFASLSRNGLNLPQTYILKITDAANKTIDEWKPSKGDQAVRPEAAYIVDDMLSDPNASYFPAGRKPHRYNGGQGTWNFAMKTGTTNDGKDGWMMGFSTKYAAGVWVGYHSRQRVMSGTMENMTQPIWQGWMDSAHKNLKPVDRERPSGLQSLPAYIIRNHIGIGSVEPSPANELYPSWYKQPSKANSGAKTIDTVSGKIATECTPDKARQQVSNADANIFSIDPYFGNKPGSTTTDTDDVHKCDDRKPGVSLTVNDNGSGQYQFIATVSQGSYPLTGSRQGTVNFYVNGQIVTTQNINNADVDTVAYNYTATASGSATVKAEVVDSVLYSATDEKAVNLAQGSAALTLSHSRANTTTENFSWAAYSGAGSYKLCVVKTGGTGPDPGCVNSTNTSEPKTLTPGASYEAYVSAYTGSNGDGTKLTESAHVTFTF